MAVSDRSFKNRLLSAAQASEKRGAKTVQPLDVYHGILSVPTLHGILGFALQGPHVGAFAQEAIAKMQSCTAKKVKVVCDRKAAKEHLRQTRA